MRNPIPLLSLAVALAAFSTGCSFNRAWQRAAVVPSRSTDIVGRWEGSWSSEVNGHNGKLRCLLTRSDAGEYTAWFHATYRRVLPLSASYRVSLQVTPEGSDFRLHGEEDLGWLYGGDYTYDGAATSTNLFSSYRSEYDHGTFQLTRPNEKP